MKNIFLFFLKNMAIKIKGRNLWLTTNEPSLFYDSKFDAVFNFNESNFTIQISSKYMFVDIDQEQQIMFFTKKQFYEELGEFIPTYFTMEDEFLCTKIEDINYYLDFDGNNFVFVKKRKSKIEIVSSDVSCVDNNVFISEGNILSQKVNFKLTKRSFETYNRELQEYEIIKHILLNDKTIIPSISYLSKSVCFMELYDGDLDFLRIYDDYYIIKEKKYNWESNESLFNHIFKKIIDLFKRLWKLGIYHGDFFLRNIVFKYIDGSNIDVRVIDFDSASFIYKNIDNIIENSIEIYDIKFNTIDDIMNYEYDLLVDEIKSKSISGLLK